MSRPEKVSTKSDEDHCRKGRVACFLQPLLRNVRSRSLHMNLYLSEVEVLEGTRPTHATAVDTVLAFCTRRSMHCWRSVEWVGYSEIERRIGISEIFVALIDKYWTSSTWKGHEFTYASGAPGFNNGAKVKQIPTRIAFLADGLEFPAYLRGCPAPITVTHTHSELKDALASTHRGLTARPTRSL